MEPTETTDLASRIAEMSRAFTAAQAIDERLKNWLMTQEHRYGRSLIVLSEMTDKELLKLDNIGKYGVQRLRKFFALYGFHPKCERCGK